MGRVADPIRGLRSALANRAIRRVQIAWSACITAEFALSVGLAVYAFRAGGVVGVGILALVRTMPAALLGPVLATLVDRGRRERLLVAVYAGRAATLALAAGAAAGGMEAVLYGLAALDATIYTLNWPAQSALLPDLARSPAELTAANAASTTVENLGTLIGPSLGALLLTVGGVGEVLWTASALLAAGAVTMVGVRPIRDVVERVDTTEEPWVSRVGAGFAVVLREPNLRLVVGLYLAQTFALGGLGTLIVAASFDLLGLGEPGVGLLTAAMGAGGLVGAAGSLGVLGHRRLATVLGWSLLVWGLAVSGIGALPVLAAALAALLVVGACNATVDVSALTLLQRLVPAAVLGRVLGVFEGAWWAALGLGGFVASLLARGAGPRGALVVVGGALAAVAVVFAQALRRLEQQVPAPESELAALATVPMFAVLDTVTQEQLAHVLEASTAQPGQVLIRQGDPGDRFYLIDDGAAEVHLAGGERVTLGPGDGFGEIALLHDVPRTATVTALTAMRLFALDREPFLAAVTGTPASRTAADALIARRQRPQEAEV